MRTGRLLLLFSAVLCSLLATGMSAATGTTGDGLGRRNAEKRSHMMSYLQDWPPSDDDSDDDTDDDGMNTKTESYNDIARYQQNNRGGGVAYVRWGHEDCPRSAELVYRGRAAGSHFSHRGGGANYQCITLRPTNFEDNLGPGTSDGGYIYGTEYQIHKNTPLADLKLHDHDVPCAVCYVSTRSAIITIPGTHICPSGWRQEYNGFLMSAHHAHHRSTFECVDLDAMKALAGHANADGALFYFVEPRCGSLPCPPYNQEDELTCAVCTRP